MTKIEAIVLSGLLHDIGKMYMNVLDKEFDSAEWEPYKYKHAFYTKKFFEDFQSDFRYEISRPLADHAEDNIIDLASMHHAPKTPLQTIIQQADLIANGFASEQNDKKSDDSSKASLLHALFEAIDLSESPREQKYFYDLQSIDLAPDRQVIFPKMEIPTNGNWRAAFKKNLFEPFIKQFKNLASHNFYIYFNSMISLLEKYAWCVPTQFADKAVQDVSLFDHSKVVAAIASCLYSYHSKENTINIDEINNFESDKFLLVGGDLSGIQNYLFNLVRANIRGLSKILRARSFYITELCNVASHYILMELQLPLCCNLMEAGGRFILIVPNTDWAKGKLKEVYDTQLSWFKSKFAGELTINLSWDVSLRSKDFSIETFPEKLNELNEAIELKRIQKYINQLQPGKKWQADAFKIDVKEHFESQYGDGNCGCCGKFPAIKTISKKDLEFQDRDIKYCKTCADLVDVGKALVNLKILTYSDQQQCGSALSFFNKYYLKFVDEEESIDRSCYLAERVYESKETKKFLKVKYSANYVPRFQDSDRDELCPKCRIKDTCEVRDEFEAGHIKTYECLATSGLEMEPDRTIRGKNFLGILRADVDRMGYVLGFGLDHFSMSHYTSLSRMINMFFTGYLPELLKAKFNNIYTVYSGGDDLFLIGEWKQVIDLAKQLNQDFRNFTCQNKDMHLSAGIVVVKPRYPINRAADWAKRELEKSKERSNQLAKENRNQFTMFDTTVGWKDFEKLMEYANILNENLLSGTLNTGFLYRLLTYHRMYLRAIDEGEARDLIYQALMSHDLKRNIIKTEEDLITKKHLIDELYKLYGLDIEDKSLMRNLKIPLFWTLYKNRQ